MDDEENLKAKLRAIEALFAGATTAGERDAADRARQRIAARLCELRDDDEVEWQFTRLNPWSLRLLVGLARRYGLQPYRYKRQHHSTRVVRTSERFLRETFLPEYDRMCDALFDHLDAVAERVVADVLHGDLSEAPVVDSPPRQLEVFATEDSRSSR
jgi:hypothetical protein